MTDPRRIRILFLAASPGSMGQVNAGREAREIREALRATAHRDSIELVERFAVRPGDLQQTFFEVRPHIVHFSGHGTTDEEIVLEDDEGGAEPLGKRALADLFRVHKDQVRVVVLNACHSRPQVEAISEHIECAIGMRRAIGSQAATEFAAAFYLAIGFGSSVQKAFESAVAQLRARGIPEDRTPQLVLRPGADATQVRLMSPSQGGRSAAPAATSSAMKKKVLWVDDDPFALLSMSFWLTDRGHDVLKANTTEETMLLLESDHRRVGCAIIDLCLPGPSSPLEPSGLGLARAIKREWPGIPLICLSSIVSAPAVEWFEAYGAGYFHKHGLATTRRLFLRTVEKALTGRPPAPRALVIHGHARSLLADLKSYLTGELGWTDVRVLEEVPSRRRSVVQKFNDEAQEAEIVLVLLSPDDVTFASADQPRSPGAAGLVFELGYFLGSSKRQSRKVIVLTTAGATLPMQVDDIVVIDASTGLRSVEAALRSEMEEWIE